MTIEKATAKIAIDALDLALRNTKAQLYMLPVGDDEQKAIYESAISQYQDAHDLLVDTFWKEDLTQFDDSLRGYATK